MSAIAHRRTTSVRRTRGRISEAMTSTASRIHPAMPSAVNMIRPMPSPSAVVMPGAVNFSGASMSESPMISPSQSDGTMRRSAAAVRGMPPGYPGPEMTRRVAA